MMDQPRLARGVTITRRQVGEDEIYYLVRDPRTGSFLRMGEVEAAVLRLLDGRRTLEEVARTLDEAHGFLVGVPVLQGFIAGLTKRGLVESRAFDPVAFREEWIQRERSRRRTLGRLLGTLATLKVRLFNPHRLFTRVVKPLGFFWTPAFVACSMALMACAALMALLMQEEIGRSMREFYHSATSSAGSFASHAWIIYSVFFIVVAVHELAHGLTCAHFGGRVTDMGFILFYLQVPGFYCDITDAYSFERRGDRLWTTIAGGYSGLVLASLGVFLWWMTDPGDLLNGASIVLMVVGGPPLLILNWNPLMRLDGYYILMDLLEAPNLMDNSLKYLGWLFKSRVLRVPCDAMDASPRLRRIYLVYGSIAFFFIAPFILAMPMIVYYIFSDLFGEAIGAGLGLMTAYRVLVKPAVKGLSTLRYTWLSYRPLLVGSAAGQAGRARLGLMGAGAAVVVLAMLLGPRFAVRAQAIGVLEPLERIEVRAAAPGFVTLDNADMMPREGAAVRAGDLLVRLEDRDLQAQWRGAGQELAAARLDMEQLMARGDPAAAAVRRAEEQELAAKQGTLARLIDLLALRAPIDGVVLTPRLDQRLGTYLPAGATWCEVGRVDRLRVRLPLSERDLGVIHDGAEAQVKGLHMPWRAFPGRLSRLPAGKRPAPPQPLTMAGAAPAAPVAALAAVAAAGAAGSESTVTGSLEAVVEVDNPSGLLRPGMTVRVRVYGDRLSPAGHALRWARRLFKGKVWW